jgi:hypothetical protein
MKGLKTGGRVAGTPNKTPFDAYVAAHKHNCNPFEVLAIAANGDMPCCVCFGTGRTKYMLDGAIHERECQSCYGTLREHISPETRVKAASELAQYLASKRKQVDNISSDGSMRPVWVVNIARETPKQAIQASAPHTYTPSIRNLAPIDVPALPAGDDDERTQ